MTVFPWVYRLRTFFGGFVYTLYFICVLFFFLSALGHHYGLWA